MQNPKLQIDFLSSLKEIMAFHDIYPPFIELNTQQIKRFKSSQTCKSNCCFYSIFYNQIGAYFGCWRRDIHVKWFAKDKTKLSREEISRLKIQNEKIQKEKEENKKVAILKCNQIWESAKEPDHEHPYFKKKQIAPYYCKQHGQNLIIPVFGFDGQIQAIQYIQPDGFKLFEKGSSFIGGYFPLGEEIVSPTRLCEGYATGCSIYEAVGQPVIVCFNAHNLIHIARWLRKKHPSLDIHICADDDRKLEKNIGVLAAIKTAEEINAKIIFPDFSKIPDNEYVTDFNDLLCLAGIEEVENQLINK